MVLDTLTAINPVSASIAYQGGDVLVGSSSSPNGGTIGHYTNSGTLLETLSTGANSSEVIAECFDAQGNLYAGNFQAQTMTKFDNSGNVLKNPGAGPGTALLSRALWTAPATSMVTELRRVNPKPVK